MRTIVLSLSAALSLGTAVRAETGFLDRSVSVSGREYRYQVYVPAGWSAGKLWPTILFLHGAGERGDDGVFPTAVGLGNAIRRSRERFPCLVVFPQCRKDLWWTLPTMQDQAMAALDASVKEFHGDPARVTLTGLSMGGYGTWGLAARFPGKFAALAPICGGIKPPPNVRKLAPALPEPDPTDAPYAETAKMVGRTPVWVFHSRDDPVVPVEGSRKMVEALKPAGGDVRYDEYDGLGHNAWDKAYGNEKFIEWMLAQRRDSPK